MTHARIYFAEKFKPETVLNVFLCILNRDL